MPIFEPKAGGANIRDPRDKKQTKGRMRNPPRFQKLGGLDGPGALDREDRDGDAWKWGIKVDKPMPGAKP